MQRLTHSSLWVLIASLAVLVGCKPAATPDQALVPATVEVASPIVEAMPPATINDPSVINYQGFGPAKFGSNEEAVRMSWGRPLNASQPADGSTCFYLNSEVMPDAKRGIGFMFEDGKFVRYDVNDVSQIAPGNYKVGDAASAINRTFAGRVEQAPHKYITNGFTLTVTPEDKSAARLVFEIAEDGKILNWRIGVPPQVFYVEGCN